MSFVVCLCFFRFKLSSDLDLIVSGVWYTREVCTIYLVQCRLPSKMSMAELCRVKMPSAGKNDELKIRARKMHSAKSQICPKFTH